MGCKIKVEYTIFSDDLVIIRKTSEETRYAIGKLHEIELKTDFKYRMRKPIV